MLEPPGPEAAVLIVDPDLSAADRLRPVVLDAGLAGRVDAVPTLGEGLDALATEPYALVVLSLAAGDVDGPESLDRIRAIDPEVPVVLVTDVPHPRPCGGAPAHHAGASRSPRTRAVPRDP